MEGFFGDDNYHKILFSQPLSLKVNPDRMLPFFRKIRYNLVVRSKFYRYFKYAFGEIVLVVIGILIALTINNWNENRKYRMLEVKLLKDVSKNLVKDTLYLNSIIEHYAYVIEQAESIKSEMDKHTAYDNSMEEAFAVVSVSYAYESDYSIFETIKSTGLDIIQNDSIRNGMVNYYNNSRHFANVHDTYNITKYFRTNVYPKYFSSYSWGKQAKPLDYESLKNANEFKLALDYAINDARYYKVNYTNQKAFAMKLNESILKEISIDSDSFFPSLN
jgi:hypothetical protein